MKNGLNVDPIQKREVRTCMQIFIVTNRQCYVDCQSFIDGKCNSALFKLCMHISEEKGGGRVVYQLLVQFIVPVAHTWLVECIRKRFSGCMSVQIKLLVAGCAMDLLGRSAVGWSPDTYFEHELDSDIFEIQPSPE